MSQTDVKINTVKNKKPQGNQQKKKAPKGEKTDETRKPYFLAAEGSDAESKSELKSFGVPHWETLPTCINELIDQDLVEHDVLEKHP